jgi:magnesium chelatase family protein
MSLAVLMSRSLVGIQAPVVRVEAHLASGLPSFTIVGLADAEVRESRERVRAAIQSSGFSFPCGRLTINLSPADLPKESGRFDLPIALGVLLASGQIDMPELVVRPNQMSQEPCLTRWVFAGELSLSGGLVPIAGSISIALAVARDDPEAVLVLPSISADLAARVPGVRIFRASSLSAVVQHLVGIKPLPVAAHQSAPPAEGKQVCLSEVKGQQLARRALEVAAAGGHSILMTGSPGVGKSMLSRRLPSILPALSQAEALEVASIAAFSSSVRLDWGVRPYRSPHHCASVAAMLGGGGKPRPGEVTLAHKGVLFLDEAPEFDRRVLEGLREPLELKEVCISRARQQVIYPADFQLIAAMNPCPCGWNGHARMQCSCRPDMIHRYQGRLSGPLLDRIDISIYIREIDQDWMDLPPGEPSSVVRERVERARLKQLTRQGCANYNLASAAIDQHCAMSKDAHHLLLSVIQSMHLSARAIQKIRKVARTCADLDDVDQIQVAHLSESVQFRHRVVRQT